MVTMRDPNLNMERNAQGQEQTGTPDIGTRRSQNKTARVAFGPKLETFIPSSAASPPAASGHQRSLTGLDQTQSGESSNSAADLTATSESRRPLVVSPQASDVVTPNRRSTPALLRTKSDFGPRLGLDRGPPSDDDEAFHIRHGWQEEYTSSEYLKILHSVSASCYSIASVSPLTFYPFRHFTCISRKSAMKRAALRRTRRGAGPAKIGA